MVTCEFKPRDVAKRHLRLQASFDLPLSDKRHRNLDDMPISAYIKDVAAATATVGLNNMELGSEGWV